MSDGVYEIDGDALARTPLPELIAMLGETPPRSAVRNSLRAVIRVVAVHMIGGATPGGMTGQESVRRARELLQLLNTFPT